jgi:diguanylate cyclase (GGDEF)-like protein
MLWCGPIRHFGVYINITITGSMANPISISKAAHERVVTHIPRHAYGAAVAFQKPPCLRFHYLLLSLFCAVSVSLSGHAEVIDVNGQEHGEKITGIQEIWHDPDKNQTLLQAKTAYDNGEFKPLDSAGSTGLARGAFWSHFAVRNTTNQSLRVQFEYIDHQLIALEAFDKPESENEYRQAAKLSLDEPFARRAVPHTRFVFELTLSPFATHEVLVKFSSEQMGFVFPSMRIWQADQLKSAQAQETSVMAFLIGGFFVMSLFSLVAGLTTNEKMFYAYSSYSISKIIVWGTVLGYTHKYLITDNYNWSYMSLGGSISIFCGIIFSRILLQSRRYTPKLDIVARLMIANSIFLFLCGLFRFNALAIISITVALLLYPTLTIISVVRWRQGSTEALVFGLGWSLLIFGLVAQALRDMGFVAHNQLNYYWPPVASFVEMLTIMVAMGIRVRKLRVQKDQAEYNYREQMEGSKAELEDLVQERTKELDEAKKKAEAEARTDPLTGINNRRHFLALANGHIGLAKRKNLSLCLLMLDIDHFKSINDTYGHYAGDAALLAFSKAISLTIRESDIFGRMGGEEFAVLLDEETPGALELAERLREKVEGIRLGEAFSKLTFTVSIGLARFELDDTAESLIKKADTALYRAKENGRNCVVEYSPPQHRSSAGVV